MGVPRIDIAEYDFYRGPRQRISSLHSEVFYQPVDIAPTPALEVASAQAIEALLDDGFPDVEARESVAMHIHAAAVFASTAEDQDGLEHNVVDVSGAPPLPMTVPGMPDAIDGSEAISIMPFLTHLVPYEFDTNRWLKRAEEVTDSQWELAKPALRWLDLWQDQLPQAAIGQLLTQYVAPESKSSDAGEAVAMYSTRLQRIFSDKPKVFDYLLSTVRSSESLALFGELGPDAPNLASVLDELGDEAPVRVDDVRQVRHVNHFAGMCRDMESGYNTTLIGKHAEVSSNYGNLVTVSVKGTLLGSIKMFEDHSMLALRSVEDAQGRLPLVIGGVYVPRSEVIDQAIVATIRQGRWAHIDVDSLAVRPLRFLGVNKPGDITSLGQTVRRIKKARQKLMARSVPITEGAGGC